MGVGVRPNGFTVAVGGIPCGDVNAGVHVSSADVVQNKTLVAPRTKQNAVALFSRFNRKGFGFEIQDEHVGQRHHGVHQSQRQHGVHTVLDDVLLSPSSEEDDQRCEGENSDQLHQDPAHLRGSRCAKSVEFSHVVVGPNVHGKSDGGHEHARHTGHATPLLSHQCAEGITLPKFVFDLGKPLGDLASLIGISIAHGLATPLSHISVAFFRRKNRRGKEPWRSDGCSQPWWT